MKQENILRVILSPHFSEKTTIGAEKRREYAFKVASNATKKSIKAAVEELFKVSIEGVRVLNTKAKPRRFGSIQGHTKAWKKAYVTLKEGQEISFLGNEKS